MELNLKDLSSDLAKLLVCGDYCDMIIRVGEGPNIKEFRVHSAILGIRSTYFRTALSKDWIQKKNGIIIFEKPNISPEIFEIILKYLYTGIIELENRNILEILKLLVAVDELDLSKLNNYIQTYITANKSVFIREDPIEILKVVAQHGGFDSGLKDSCIESLCSQLENLFESSRFLTLDKSIILLLLERNDLLIEEIVVWDNILKWGIAQMESKPSIENVLHWTDENFVELERVLHDCIPLIKWTQIPLKKFWENRLFERIFPKNLFQSILGYLINPDDPFNSAVNVSSRNFNSTLIEQYHFSMISNWINKNDQDHYNKSTPHSFRLLYRASKDGFQPQRFHELCDNKGATIMIAKIKDEEKLIGGYNPLDWKPYNTLIRQNGSWQETSDSFLFSFKNKCSKTGNIIRVSSPVHAVSYVTNCGPCFGGGWDLKIGNYSMSCDRVSRYAGIDSVISVGINYSLEDYEVFQVIRR